uniref:Thymidylate synthase n=1 Tax=viral metagenome TaxID=1070528 RepID=A0A6C0M067_9ZZZZ
MERVPVLDHGFVELVDRMGDDYRILQSARVSTGSDASKGAAKDRNLVLYLYRNKHMSPFEQVQLTFHVKCPIFVARQWMRHRTMSFNEYSMRYSNAINECYVPQALHAQSSTNHQGSNSESAIDANDIMKNKIRTHYEETFKLYDSLIDAGVSREEARCIIPVGCYTEFYFTVDLRNLFHFLELRLDAHAQYEIRVYANAILAILKSIDGLKWALEAFCVVGSSVRL